MTRHNLTQIPGIPIPKILQLFLTGLYCSIPMTVADLPYLAAMVAGPDMGNTFWPMDMVPEQPQQNDISP